MRYHRAFVAVLFAALSVLIAAWVLRSHTGSHTRDRRNITPIAPEPNTEAHATNTTLPSYRDINDDADVMEAMADFRSTVHALAIRDVAINELGTEAAATIAEAAIMSIGPLVSGSFEEYRASVRAMGGDPDSVPNESTIGWDQHQERFSLRPTAVNDAKLLLLGSGDIHGRLGTLAQSATESGYPRMSATRVPDRYPGVNLARPNSGPAVEVRIPMLARSPAGAAGEPVMIGVVLVWNQQSKRWQPGQYNVYTSQARQGGIHLQLLY